jgi:hypothetical protein
MKYCPTCETRYDEEILRFCMKDGTPLVNEDEPKFTEMPSESFDVPEVEDDPGEVTVIRKNIPVPPPPPADEDEFLPREEPKPRIVVPMASEPVRPRPTPQYQAPPKSNTLKVVVLTVIGTVSLLALGALGLWAFMRGTGSAANSNANNANVNANTDLNVNTNTGVNFNFNTNVNSNLTTGVNTNANANLRTPTPSPTPTATPTASPTATPRPSESPEERP